MLKFLRKYNTWILVFGGSLLMVVFLLPQALTQLGSDPRSQTAYRVDGAKVSVGEREMLAREMGIINAIAAPLRMPEELTFLVTRLDSSRDDDRWVLMVKEAQRAGLVGGVNDGASFMPKLAELTSQAYAARGYGSFPPEQFQVFLQAGRQGVLSRGFTEDDVDRALAHMHGVVRLREAFAGAQRISEPRARREAKEILDEAVVDMVFATAERSGNAGTPTDEQLGAFFEKYREVTPSEGEYGIGYMLPPRVKVEFLTIDFPSLVKSIELDPIEVRRRYDRSGSTEPFADVRASFEKQVRTEKAEEVFREADRAIETAVRGVASRLPKDGDFVRVPAGWDDTPVRLETLRDEIARRVKESLGLEIAPPQVTILADQWRTQDELVAVGEIGRASVQRPVFGLVNLPQAVLGVREIASTTNPLKMQVGLPCTTPFETFSQSRVYVRVLDARDTSPPDSLDEVRERVATDWRTVQQYDEMLGFIEDNRRSAAERGVSFLVDTRDVPGTRAITLREGIIVRTGGARMGPNLQAVVRELDEDAREAILTAAEKIDPTRPASEQDADMRTLALPNKKERGVAFVQITGYIPATEREFLRLEGFGTLGNRIRQREFSAALDAEDPFSLRSLVRRLNVTGLPVPEEDDGAKADADASGA